MKSKIFFVAAFLCAAFVAFGQAGAGGQSGAGVQVASGVQAVDSLGLTVRLAKPASRIVSLSPASTEVLFAVGATVVGDTTYCVYPPEALAVEKVGGYSADSMSIEKILSLKPDLVVSNGTIHKPATDELARYGIPTFAYDPSGFEGIAAGIVAIGTLAGRKEAAVLVASIMKEKIAKVEKTLAVIPASQRLSVFWEVYNDPLMTCGSATFQHAIVEAGGGRDIFSDLPGSWPMVSIEEVIRRAPQVIMGADDHGEALTLAAIAKRPGWNLVPAVRSGKIFLIPTGIVSNPGPRVADGVLSVAKALYPRLFP